MEIPTLKVEPRGTKGKGPAGRLRRKGLVPGVCYGRGKPTLDLVLDPTQLRGILAGPRGRNALIKLEGLSEPRMVFVQEIQSHPVSRQWVHVDFLHVDPDKPIVRPVPIELVGRPEGVKVGGVLQIVSRTVEVECLPSAVPEKISLDVSALQIGQSIHVKDVPMPAGVKAIFDTDYTICAVVAPTEEKKVEEAAPAEGEAAAAAEGEGAAPAAEAKAEEGEKGEKEKKEKKPAAEKGAKKKA